MIYAINKQTKEHVDVTDMSMPRVAQYLNIDEWYLVGADADGWIPWHGGECPLPDFAQCMYRMRDGDTDASEGSILWWEFEHDDTDIIAYRPILNTEPKEPEWDGDCPPPVGCVCEGHVQDTARQWRWVAVEVLMQKEYECAVHVPSMGVLRWCDEFRPIRTPAQRAEDEAVMEMVGIVGDFDHNEGACRALYRAGYRPQAEG